MVDTKEWNGLDLHTLLLQDILKITLLVIPY